MLQLKNDCWYQAIKEKRLAYGVSQNKLAVAVGITREYLNKIENGKSTASRNLQEQLEHELELFNPEAPLDMLFDYVRIRFPTCDYTLVIESILRMKVDVMLHEDFGYYSYPEHLRFGDIMVLVSHDISKGVLLELKGKGCRQYENLLLAQHRNWFDFFTDCLLAGGIFKRLDLAINDKVGILDIPELANKCKQEECISVFRSFKNYRSGELVRHDEKIDMGNTLYIGSLKSEVYFCIYEKDYEQYKKNNIPIAEAETKNRFEIRLKNERAILAIYDLLEFQDAEKTAFSIINRYLRFADKEPKKRRSDWKTSERWAWFIGDNRRCLRLTTDPQPYTFERTLNWLHRQVAPTLKIVQSLDDIKGTNIVNDMIQDAKLTDRHEKILEQQALAVEDIIIQSE